MNKYVISYQWGDEYEVGIHTGYICIEYESYDKLLFDIDKWAKDNPDEIVTFAGTGFNGTDLSPHEYFNDGFLIQELDEWFNRQVGK